LSLAIGIAFVGGVVSFAASPLFATAAIYVAFASNSRARWAVVCLVIGLMAVIFHHDKRVAIFLILAALHLEIAARGRLALSARTIAGGVVAAAAILYLLAAMSILRGYGGF